MLTHTLIYIHTYIKSTHISTVNINSAPLSGVKVQKSTRMIAALSQETVYTVTLN